MTIQQLIVTQDFTRREISKPERAIMFLHNHPNLVKTIKLSAIVFGAFTTLYTAYNRKLNIASISLATAGFISSSFGYITHKVLDIIAPAKHNMKNHLFTPAKIKDAHLYYEGDIPILKITTTDPYLMGLAQGKLLAKNIDKLRTSFSLAMQTFPPLMPFIHSTPKVEKLRKVINEIKKQLPDAYINEMLGIVEGYNTWAKSKYFFKPKPLTLDEILLFHLEPDVPHFKHLAAEKRLNKTAACAAIVDREQDGNIVFGRMMDWPTLGNADAIVIVKENPKTNIQTLEVSIPGTIFTLSAMNNHGLSLCMNICYGNTTKVDGMPNALVVKRILNECKSLKDVEKLLPTLKSLGPFHLIAADRINAAAFYIKQDKKMNILQEDLKIDQPIVVTNLSKDLEVTDNVNFAKEREEKIGALFDFVKYKFPLKLNIIKEALKLPFVDNIMSAHKIIMKPGHSISLAFDSAYAGKNTMQEVFLTKIFG
jgi:hypothetical protein